MQINYIQHENIDKSLWDKTIESSSNGNIYGHSWYLDAVCPGWDALISRDYNMIMPLTGNRKYGISYIFRPLLSQQLGLFSLAPPTSEEVDAFLLAIPANYRLVQFCMNKFNHPSGNFETKLHDTYEIQLKPDYEVLRDKFSSNHIRNIKKADTAGLQIIDNLEVGIFMSLLLDDTSQGSTILSGGKNLKVLNRLITNAQIHSAIKLLGINNEAGKTIAAVFFGHSHKSWFYLVPVSTEEGKKKRALFAIINHLIYSRSGNDEILDFEGSDIPGLAQFYRGFGASKIQYPEFRRNNLPWPIKYLK